MENKKVDPGWNDPPMLKYSPSNPPPKSRIINKRVAFPVGPATSSTLPANLSGNSISEQSACPQDEKIPDMERLAFSNFYELLKLAPNDGVLVKIELMKNMWKCSQFSNDLKNEIYELSDSLRRNDCDSANKLHLKLLMNNSSECKNWISAMQYFISNMPK